MVHFPCFDFDERRNIPDRCSVVVNTLGYVIESPKVNHVCRAERLEIVRRRSSCAEHIDRPTASPVDSEAPRCRSAVLVAPESNVGSQSALDLYSGCCDDGRQCRRCSTRCVVNFARSLVQSRRKCMCAHATTKYLDRYALGLQQCGDYPR